MRADTNLAKTIEGIGLLVGMIIGAGLFALPYSFLKAGLVWGLFLFVGIFLLSWILHLLYAAIIYTTPGRHRFTGYIKRYLGPSSEMVAFIVTLFGTYGAMLAYGVLGAIFLQNIFASSFLFGGLLFFVLGGALFFLSLGAVGKINFYLTLPLLAFILIMGALLVPDIDSVNFSSPLEPEWFLPYGVLLFAFGGYSALPDMHDVLGANSRRAARKIIFLSLLISAIFYLIFTLAVLGRAGTETSQDALSGLERMAGKGVVVVGSLIGLLAVFTSYIVFGADLKLLFRYDYNISGSLAWLLAFLPPVLLFLFGFTNLVKILNIVGSVGLGVFGAFIVWISWKERVILSSFLGFMPRAFWLLSLGILVVLGAVQSLF